jgi:thioredoxin 1
MASKNDSAMEVTGKEFDELISNGHKLVVVDFFADWCMPCLMLAPIIEEMANEMKDVKFVKIDVDDNQELAQRFQIRSIPTLIFFKDGEEVDKVVGGMDADSLEEKINNLIS